VSAQSLLSGLCGPHQALSSGSGCWSMPVPDAESSAGCSILSLSVPQFSVKIVSELLVELGGYNKADCLATNYRVIVYSPKTKRDVRSLEFATAESCDLSVENSVAALDFLKSYAHEEARKALANQSEHVGFAIGLACKESGALFVCEVTMIRLWHQRFGWPYLVGVWKDVTDTISIEELLGATSDADYSCLIDSRSKTEDSTCYLGSLTEACSATQSFDQMAEDMWGTMLTRGCLDRDRSRGEGRCVCRNRNRRRGQVLA